MPTKKLLTHKPKLTKKSVPDFESHPARAKILEVSAELFATKGLDGTTTRDIAKRAKLNISLISYYFGGKEGLYVAVIKAFAQEVEKEVGALVSRFDQSELSETTLRSAILELVDTFIDLRLRYPHAGTLLTREKMAGMPHSKEIHDQILRVVGDKVKNLIIKGQKAGFVHKKINPDMFMCCLAESIVGYFVMHDSPAFGDEMQERCYGLPRDRKEFRDQICLLFLEGALK